MNRTRTSTLDAFGLRNQRNRIFPALSASDGSTLDLDFTTMGGALDSRFTFSRASNATYINSSGYVAWNNSNLFYNTAWTSTSLPTGWGEGAATGTFTYNGNGTITMTVGTLQRAYLNPAYPYTSTQTGVPFTISCTVTAVSGSPTLGDVITTNSGTDTFTVNGVAKTSAEILFANDLITCTSTATGNAAVPRIGLGISGNVTGKSITLKNPQANIGSTAQPYTANASTTTSYYAPCFDYDPTTLAAKGLLIEGSATNLQRYSATFETTGSYWYQTLGTNAAGTAATAPDNTSTPRRLTEPASGTSTGQLQISGASAGIAASTTYTVSFWAKAGSRTKVLWRCDGGGNDVGFNLSNGVATVVAGTFTTTRMTAYPNGWYRCEATWANVNAGGFPSIYLATGTGTTYTISYTCNSSYAELWGFQLELGTGASSYIPTVASQVTRSSDECYIADISSFNYSNTSASMAMQFMYAKQSTSYIEQIGFMAATDLPTLESFANGLSFFTSVRGASLSTGGANEVARTFTLNTAIKYSYSVDTTTDPILRVNLNSSASSINKSGTGNMHTPTRFVFGRLPAASYGSNFGSITIKSVKYWPTTKTAAELAALTA